MNIIFGTLQHFSASKPILASTEILHERVNNETITRLVVAAVNNFVGSSGAERVLLLVTDAARYMIAAGQKLQNIYPNMIHITCLAHCLHRICERVRDNYTDVDSFVSNVKKIFLKAPNRIHHYKQMCPNLPLPPKPVITRWGTWILAVMFYSKNFEVIKAAILSIDDSARSVCIAKQLLGNINLKRDIDFINHSFGFIPDVITLLETQGLKLTESLNIFNEAVTKMQCIPNSFNLQQYIKDILYRNPGYKKLCDISALLETTNNEEHPDENIMHYNFVPVTNCDVERSFSAFKDILSSKRHGFTEENLAKYTVVYCNK